MPIISARIVMKPRKMCFCADCEFSIRGPSLRLYGYADVGDRPSTMRICARCVKRSFDPKLKDLRERLLALAAKGKPDDEK